MSSAGVKVWVLEDWPESLANPTCTNPDCGRTIQNGQQYIVMPGTLQILCSSCMMNLHDWKSAIDVIVEGSQQRSREAKDRINENRKQARAAQRQRDRAEGRIPASRQRAMGPPAICPTCEQEFQPARHGVRGTQKYCSFSCRPNAYVPVHMVTCLSCPRQFRTRVVAGRGTYQKYCTRACANAAKLGRTFDTPPPLRWSTAYDACRDCGTTRRRHRANGLCPSCYLTRQRAGIPFDAPPFSFIGETDTLSDEPNVRSKT